MGWDQKAHTIARWISPPPAEVPMKRDPASFADQLIQDAFTDATGGLDVTTGRKCLRSLSVALLKQCERLEVADYQKLPIGETAKANHYTVKVADVLFRLIQFAQGDPDSRPELVGGQNWLEALTGEQLKQVKVWLKQNLEAQRPA